MSQAVFKSLAQSLREGGAIMRGEVLPAREFVRDRPPTSQTPQTILAICIKTDDPQLLIPGKIYEARILKHRFGVVDEAGEMVLCSTDAFVPVEFEPKLESLLRGIVASA